MRVSGGADVHKGFRKTAKPKPTHIFTCLLYTSFSVAAVTKVMDGSADQWLAGATD